VPKRPECRNNRYRIDDQTSIVIISPVITIKLYPFIGKEFYL